MSRRPKYTFLQRRYTDCQHTHERMLSITNHQRNANQIYNEVSPHTGQNGHHQKNLQTRNAGEGVEKRESSCTVGGNVNCYSHYGEQYGRSLKIQKQNYHSTQQSHYWAYTLRQPKFKKGYVPQCSLQYYLKQPGHGSNLSVHQQMNG